MFRHFALALLVSNFPLANDSRIGNAMAQAWDEAARVQCVVAILRSSYGQGCWEIEHG